MLSSPPAPAAAAAAAAACRDCLCPVVLTRGGDQLPVSTKFEMRNDPNVVRNYGGRAAERAGAVSFGVGQGGGRAGRGRAGPLGVHGLDLSWTWAWPHALLLLPPLCHCAAGLPVPTRP